MTIHEFWAIHFASFYRCCVCLGEFELKEELRQLPSCKHVFHGDCIRHWLRTNATCPLCRCHVIPALKLGRPIGLGPGHLNNDNGIHNPTPQHERENYGGSSNNSELHNSSRSDEHVIQIHDESSSSNTSWMPKIYIKFEHKKYRIYI